MLQKKIKDYFQEEIYKEKGEKMENNRNEEMVIDLLEIFVALKRKIFVILATGLLCGCLACGYTMIFMEPTYTSKSTMLTISKETTLTSMADLQLGTQLTSDYKILITSTPVLEQVIENLKLNISPGGLRGQIAVNNPSGTRILELSVTNENPEMAKKIADELAAVSSAYVGDKMEVIPPKIIEEGEIPSYKSGPNVKKNAMMGLLAGLLLAAGVVCLFVVLNDSIKTEDDITKYLDIPTLASIPDRKDYITGKSRKRNKKGK